MKKNLLCIAFICSCLSVQAQKNVEVAPSYKEKVFYEAASAGGHNKNMSPLSLQWKLGYMFTNRFYATANIEYLLGRYKSSEHKTYYDGANLGVGVGYNLVRTNNEWLDHIVRNHRQIEESKGEIDLVFCGDSITHCWESRCPTILKEIKSKHSLLLAGFSGDRTEHLLWRLKYGELDGYRAKSVMLLIGTNNSADTPEKIAAGVKACLNVIREKQPQAKVVLMAIFPRS